LKPFCLPKSANALVHQRSSMFKKLLCCNHFNKHPEGISAPIFGE